MSQSYIQLNLKNHPGTGDYNIDKYKSKSQTGASFKSKYPDFNK